MKEVAKGVTSIMLVAIGMAGLYFKVEYSGWVLAAGLLVATSI